MRLTANMRMYGATAEVAALWAALAEWVSRASGVPLELIAHPPPAPIDTLWTRPDMGLVLMCGWPFQRAVPSPQIVAAPMAVCGESAFASASSPRSASTDEPQSIPEFDTR